MTKVSFYILGDDSSLARLNFAARLCDKALRQNMRTLIFADTETYHKMDTLLWDYRAESFLPHSRYGEHTNLDPIVISPGQDVPEHHDFLINLSTAVPSFFSRFARLAEIVVQSPSILTTTRANYSFYKQKGYAIESHKL